MPSLPAAYFRDTRQVINLFEKIDAAGCTDKNLLPATRDLATLIRSFLVRWQDDPAVSGQSEQHAAYRAHLLALEQQIEVSHIATLLELLTFRRCLLLAHNALASIHHLAGLLQNAPAHERVEMQRKFVEIYHKEFDPAAALAEQSAMIAEQDTVSVGLLDRYERLWPDRLDDPHYLAILSGGLAQLDAAEEELHLFQSALVDPLAEP